MRAESIVSDASAFEDDAGFGRGGGEFAGEVLVSEVVMEALDMARFPTGCRA